MQKSVGRSIMQNASSENVRHKHNYKTMYSTVDEIYVVCECGEAKKHKPTPAEIKEIKTETKRMFAAAEHSIHGVWYKFVEKFMTPNGGFKYNGYDFMKCIERFVKKVPEIEILRCDDSAQASSYLVLIPHQTKAEFHGTTVVYIPQCTSEPPTSFFLYPNHTKNLIKKLQKIEKDRERIEKCGSRRPTSD